MSQPHCCVTSLLTITALSTAACQDDAGPDPNAIDPSTPTYAVGLRVFDADFSGETGFVGFTEDLTGGALSLDDALEVPGGGQVWGLAGAGEFYVTATERGTMTKYRFAQGQLRQLGRVSFAGEGITRFLDSFVIFDGPDRGYLFDLPSLQAVEVDLETMEIGTLVDLSSLADATLPTFISYGRFLPHDTGLVAASYATDLMEQTVSPTSNIVFFDPSTGALEVLEAPCGGLLYGAEMSGGDLLFAADPFVAAIHDMAADRAPAPCMVRVSGSTREVVGEPVLLNDLTQAPTGGLIPTDGESFLVRVLDRTRLPEGPLAPLEIYGLPAWNTWSLASSPAAGATRATELVREAVPGGIAFFIVDDAVYENSSTLDFGQTTLSRANASGPPTAGLSTPGLPFNILRLR
ncbi:MAG: hypothetical protein AAGF12_18405 [Myxococcota bacterium]